VYTEIVKILEGGLDGDREKVKNYAMVLAKSLDADGETALARKVRRTLSSKKGTLAGLDSLGTQPVDSETRMGLIEVSMPLVQERDLIFNLSTARVLDDFIAGFQKRDQLMKNGLAMSNSLLLYGPPGCGKTSTAERIASGVGLPLVTARLDGLVSSLLGSTAKNIRKVFDFAASRDCVLFLDEFDVIAKLRDDKNELGELKRVVNSLLQNIDAFPHDNILIAATNHQELLDSAIWRRFSTVLSLDKPDSVTIRQLVRKFLADVGGSALLNPSKGMDSFFEAFDGLSHSDIRTVIFSAARNAVIESRPRITRSLVLKEIYFHLHHSFSDEKNMLEFLLAHGATQQDVHSSLGISMRIIQQMNKRVAMNGEHDA
jgi:SpoVK/Ycf46/Vps4 family AAA+-type ATPase